MYTHPALLIMNQFLSQTLQDRTYSYPTNCRQENVYFPANSWQEWISFPSFFPYCLGKKGFRYSKNKKEYQSWWKNSGKYRIFLGGTLGFAVLHPWYSPQKLYAFLCSFLKIIIFSSIFIPEPHTLYIEYISYLETWISIFYLLIQQIFTAWESMSILFKPLPKTHDFHWNSICEVGTRNCMYSLLHTLAGRPATQTSH